MEMEIGDIRKLPAVSLTFDFQCLEGWAVENTVWQGARVAEIIRLADPMEEAQYAVFRSGDFSECFHLRTVMESDMVAAYSYMGKPLTPEHGGPVRLVFPSQACYQSIKWLEEIRLVKEFEKGSAREIALGRIGRL